MAQLPRGIRNNNPLNIRRNTLTKWKGERDFQTDSQFVEFQSLTLGFRAAFITLRTYIHKYKIDSVGRIIHRWAPTNENDTETYVKTVCRITGFQPSTPIEFEDKNKMVALVHAMAYVECGVGFQPTIIQCAYDLVRNNTPV